LYKIHIKIIKKQHLSIKLDVFIAISLYIYIVSTFQNEDNK